MIEAIRDLPLLEPAVYLMHGREHMPYEHIGRCLGISTHDVQAALASALKILHRRMFGP
jgi:hypothetical protein